MKTMQKTVMILAAAALGVAPAAMAKGQQNTAASAQRNSVQTTQQMNNQINNQYRYQYQTKDAVKNSGANQKLEKKNSFTNQNQNGTASGQ